jgi:putative membrane protein
MLGPNAIAWWGLRTQTSGVRVEGLANVPADGPVMLVARHFHHLLDGAVLVTRLARPIHIVVGLDWAASPRQRRLMEWMCRSADYPIVLRPPTLERTGAYRRDELLRYTRAAFRQTTRLLRAGRVVLVFAEGYPNIDPNPSRKPGREDWLPFESGFSKMIQLAERDGSTRVALVPVGFRYGAAGGERWAIEARIGAPLAAAERDVATVERRVRLLSGPASDSAAQTPPAVRVELSGASDG